MPALNPDSRRGQVRHAEAVLNSLLRTPKTRGGLIAATSGRKINKHFVFGWLTDKLRIGHVVALKSTAAPPMYQRASYAAAEKPTESAYPSWLEPRALPAFATPQIYIDGRPVGRKEPNATAY